MKSVDDLAIQPDGPRKHAISRRDIISGVLGAGVASALIAGTDLIAPRPTPRGSARVSVPVIRRGNDPQFESSIAVYNRRVRANPQRVLLPRTGAETVAAVQSVIDSGERLSIMSGGHCFEDFSLPADVDSVIHVGSMNQVGYDLDRQAYGVGSGGRLLNLYDSLFRDHGVTVPGGVCYSVGVGGHITGGGYGLLSRMHGLTVDHLAGIEIVTVDRGGQAALKYVSRSDSGDDADLFWSHTGGGGGSFGVVTRFDFHSPGYEKGLPSPPSSVTLVMCSWPWDAVTEKQFEDFLATFADWCVTHHHSDPITDSVFPWMVVRHRDHGGLGLVMQIHSKKATPVAKQLIADLARALGKSASADFVSWKEMPWMNAVRLIGTGSAENNDPNRRGKQGSANLLQRISPDQAAHLYRSLTTSIPGSVSAGLDIAALGGAISVPSAGATAVFQRDSAMKLLIQTFWEDETDDAANLEWLRHTYHGLFPGGAPGYDQRTAGSYINYPNADLSDTRWNTTGLSAGEIYFGGNYSRLQRAKRRWDPNNYFRHAQSVRA